MIDPIDCPHCRGKIELKSNTNEIIKLSKDLIKRFENGCLSYIEIDENLQAKPIYKFKNARIVYEESPKPEKNPIDKLIDDIMS